MCFKELARLTGYTVQTIRKKVQNNTQLLQEQPSIKDMFGEKGIKGGKGARHNFLPAEWEAVKRAYKLV